MSGFREGDFARFRRSEKYRKIGQTVDSRPVADIRVTTHALGKYFPEDSSHHPMPVRQIFSLLLIITGLAVLTFYVPGLIDLLISLGCGLIALFYLIGMLKFEIAQPPETLLPEAELPFYSVLIPLFKEAHMVQQISKAMQNIDYPPDRIEFLYLTEAKDLQTRHAVMQAFETSMLDNRLIIVPEGIPQTKPRACNFALWQAMGELCVIFDAEDIPHPLQLREAATRFARSGNRLACLQAPLVITRPPRFSLLGRQMALEYLHLFYFVIPTLINLQLPVPLGGTSNHLRKDVMLELKGWDSWNVTEDADLGFRLARRNYRVEQIAYPTHEAATRGLGNYIRQRTRWQKGQMQTWLVRTRHPLKFIRQTGLVGFLVCNIIFCLLKRRIQIPNFYLKPCVFKNLR